MERFRELGAELEQDEPDLANPIDTWNTIACVDNLVSEGPLLDDRARSPTTPAS